MFRDVPYKPELSKQEKERRRLLACEDIRAGMRQAGVARKYGVNRSSVCKWAACLEREGPRGLRAKPAHRPAHTLSEAQLKEVERVLLRGARAYGFETDLWTLPRVQRVIRERFGVRLHISNVSRNLHRAGFSWQRPARRARERDEPAIRRWVRKEWPRILKKQST